MQKTQRTIIEVLDIRDGSDINANTFFEQSLDIIHQYRSELQKAIEGIGPEIFVCYYCRQKIRIRGGKGLKRKTDAFHFAHLKDSDECHIKTKHTLTKEEVDRIKYNGAKESLLHKDLKAKIELCLRKNEEQNKGIHSIEVEKVINNKVEKEWKKPDINAFFNEKRIAFELQLSTTWLDVITRRQHFYKEQGIYIIWLFNSFDPNDDIRVLTQNDVIYTNNQNAYVFDEEAYEASIKSNDLVIKCVYKSYSQNDIQLDEEWMVKLITLSDIIFNDNELKLYHHDSKKQKELILQKINRLTEKKKLAKEKTIKERSDKLIKLDQIKHEIADKKAELSKSYDNSPNANKTYNSALRHYESCLEIKENIQNYTDKIAQYLCSQVRYSPIPGHYEFLDNLSNKFSDKLINLWQRSLALEQKETSIKKRIETINKLQQIMIGSSTYHSIPISEYWDYITENNNWSKLKIIKKNAVYELFADQQLRQVSLRELERLKYDNNHYFLIDFTSHLDQHNDSLKPLSEEQKEHNKEIAQLKAQILELSIKYFHQETIDKKVELDEALSNVEENAQAIVTLDGCLEELHIMKKEIEIQIHKMNRKIENE